MDDKGPAPNVTTHRKHYIPLESNPEVFTELIHKLGVSESLAFQDVLSIDDPDLIALIPRPVFALVLVFPTSGVYEEQKAAEEADYMEYDGSGEKKQVMWFKQTINNACGLYGILHAVSNGDSKGFILANSTLAKLLDSCLPLPPILRARVLEDSKELESAYKHSALQGDSNVPENAEDEVDFHYVCFVKSHKDGHLYEMDGDRKGPVNRGALALEDDLLSTSALKAVRRFIHRERNDTSNFGLLALVPA